MYLMLYLPLLNKAIKVPHVIQYLERESLIELDIRTIINMYKQA